ncbi:MAG: UDP-N-acetylmuramoyl-tripeptide--D-alanyl-D-alanine ligase [Firmicutes bacterium]|nr:UDP-N-acetylmuramoyl-tripeptide--D-alanyl-D-alanine ligase [Bacillota bacterium]
MERYTLLEIANATGGKLFGENLSINSVTTDSNKGGEGCIFIAIKGERFDGNDFAEAFLKKGSAVITSKNIAVPQGKAVIFVNNTRTALYDFARHHLKKHPVPVTAVTGSVGKTSTKDLIALALSAKFNTLKTHGNFNNDVGVPLTIFNLTAAHQAAVLEMGMNSPGEIRLLSNIAPPTAAVITNIATAHIGKLGSKENILRAKLEVLENLKPDGVAILNADDESLFSLKGNIPHTSIYYGINNPSADILAYDVDLQPNKSAFKVKIGENPFNFEINQPGEHFVYNALAAISTGVYYNIEPSLIAKSIASFTSEGLRQNISEICGVTIIEDCYNASAASMRAALGVLAVKGAKGRTIAVLGDVLEQGAFAESEHRQIGDQVAHFCIDKLITVGDNAKFIADQARIKGVLDIKSFDDNLQAENYLYSQAAPGDTILFKASRGMKLEEISQNLKKHLHCK